MPPALFFFFFFQSKSSKFTISTMKSKNINSFEKVKFPWMIYLNLLWLIFWDKSVNVQKLLWGLKYDFNSLFVSLIWFMFL